MAEFLTLGNRGMVALRVHSVSPTYEYTPQHSKVSLGYDAGQYSWWIVGQKRREIRLMEGSWISGAVKQHNLFSARMLALL